MKYKKALLISGLAASLNLCPRETRTSNQSSCRNTLYSDMGSCASYMPRSYYGIRSQGANTARELMGWEELIYRYRPCETNFVFASSFEYQTSFKSDRIANYLFGSEELHFVGSQVPGRDNIYNTQLVAENFGLPSDFNQVLPIRPKIQNYIFDFQAYMTLNSFVNGLYLRMHAPFVLSKWNLFNGCGSSLCSRSSCSTSYSCCEQEDQAYALAGSFGFDQSNVLSPIPVNSTLCQALSGKPFGDMKIPWNFGIFDFDPKLLCRLADIDLIVGWNYWDTDDSHVGGFFQFVVPTGNKPDPRYIFSPVIGNGHHYEFGGGITAHSILWYGCGDQSIGIYVEGNVTHLFKNTQVRSFDFCSNGPLSRYLLLKEIDTVSNMTNAYTGNLINAINVTTRNATIDIAVKGDVSLKFAYRNAGLGLDLGYNFYGLSKEKVTIKQGSPSSSIASSNNVRYVIQGLQPTQGFNACTGSMVGLAPQTVNLNSANANATIFNAQPDPVVPPMTSLAVPLGGDSIPLVGIVAANPLAGSSIGESTNLTACSTSDALILNPAGTEFYQTNTITSIADASALNYIASAKVNNASIVGSFSLNDTCVLNPLSGSAKDIVTQKVFLFLSYLTKDGHGFIGAGGEIEFDSNGAKKGGHDQWGIVLKGGFAY